MGQLLTVSSKGLRANWAIVPFAVALNVALAAFLVPLIALLYGAAQNGQVVRASGVSVQLGRCVDASGAQVDCCAWQPSSAASVYFFFASLAFLWTVMNFYQIRIFTIGGTIAQARAAGSPSPARPPSPASPAASLPAVVLRPGRADRLTRQPDAVARARPRAPVRLHLHGRRHHGRRAAAAPGRAAAAQQRHLRLPRCLHPLLHGRPHRVSRPPTARVPARPARTRTRTRTRPAASPAGT